MSRAPALSGAIAVTFPAESPARTLKHAHSARYDADARAVAFRWLCAELNDEAAAELLGTTAGSAVRSKIATIVRDALKNGKIQIEVFSG